MPNITKHNSKQKWKSYSCKYTWIYLFILWYSIRFYNLLKRFSKQINLKFSWNFIIFYIHFKMVHLIYFGLYEIWIFFIYLLKFISDLIFETFWNPDKQFIKTIFFIYIYQLLCKIFFSIYNQFCYFNK